MLLEGEGVEMAWVYEQKMDSVQILTTDLSNQTGRLTDFLRVVFIYSICFVKYWMAAAQMLHMLLGNIVCWCT